MPAVKLPQVPRRNSLKVQPGPDADDDPATHPSDGDNVEGSITRVATVGGEKDVKVDDVTGSGSTVESAISSLEKPPLPPAQESTVTAASNHHHVVHCTTDYAGSSATANQVEENESSDGTFEVESIDGKRVEGGTVQYQVKWLGFPKSDSTWEPLDCLDHCQQMIDEFEEKLDQRRKKRAAAAKARRAMMQAVESVVPSDAPTPVSANRDLPSTSVATGVTSSLAVEMQACNPLPQAPVALPGSNSQPSNYKLKPVSGLSVNATPVPRFAMPPRMNVPPIRTTSMDASRVPVVQRFLPPPLLQIPVPRLPTSFLTGAPIKHITIPSSQNSNVRRLLLLLPKVAGREGTTSVPTIQMPVPKPVPVQYPAEWIANFLKQVSGTSSTVGVPAGSIISSSPSTSSQNASTPGISQELEGKPPSYSMSNQRKNMVIKRAAVVETPITAVQNIINNVRSLHERKVETAVQNLKLQSLLRNREVSASLKRARKGVPNIGGEFVTKVMSGADQPFIGPGEAAAPVTKLVRERMMGPEGGEMPLNDHKAVKRKPEEPVAGTSQPKPRKKRAKVVPAVIEGTGAPSGELSAVVKRNRKKRLLPFLAKKVDTAEQETLVNLDDDFKTDDENANRNGGVVRADIKGQWELVELEARIEKLLGFVLLPGDPAPHVKIRFDGSPPFDKAFPLRIVRRILPGKLLDFYESSVRVVSKQ